MYNTSTVIKVEKRKIYWFLIYPLAALTFLVISVLFILSAKGYDIQIEKNGISFEKTGMIIVHSRPTGAEIFLDGKKHKDKTPPFFSIKINSLNREKYILTVQKDGYHKWEKEVRVFPEMVTWANYVLLFPKNPKIDNMDVAGTFLGSISSPDNKYHAILTSTPTGELINLVDARTSQRTVIFENSKFAEPDKIKNITLHDWSKDHRNILISGIINNEKVYRVINIETKNIENINVLTPVKFDNLIFNTNNGDELYGLAGKDVLRVNLREKNTVTLPENNIVYFTFASDGKIYYIKDNQGIRSLWHAGSDFSNKINLTDALPMSDSYDIKVATKTQKVAISTQKDSSLYIATKVGDKNSLISMGKNISEYSWSEDGERFYYKVNGYGGVVFETDQYRKESKEYLIPESLDLENVIWYDSRHLLGQKNGKAIIIDFDGTNQIVLGDSIPKRKVFFSPDSWDIFFFSNTSEEKTNISGYRVQF